MPFLIFAAFIILLGLAYVFLIIIYLKNWRKLENSILPANFIGNTKISVVIPIRNEAKNITALLQSIIANEYPRQLVQIIIVDDHSTDLGVDLINQLKESRIEVISLSDFELPDGFNSFKKFGISQAIEKADGELIITTDGDCLVPPTWLNSFAYQFEIKKQNFIAAPVNFMFTGSRLSPFECLDFMGMMLVTGANIKRATSMMCNGANLGYTKALFQNIGGYSGIADQASGDDVMLLNKVSQLQDGRIGFIKNSDATVITKGTTSWSAFIQQRLRWATKNSSSNDLSLKLELGIVYLTCCLLLLLPFLFFINWKWYGLLFVFLAVCKWIGDWYILSTASRFFGKSDLLKYFYSSFWIHIVYIAGIGTLSLFKKKYSWKGRQVS